MTPIRPAPDKPAPAPGESLAALAAADAGAPGRFDELIDDAGGLRPAWKQFASAAGPLGVDVLSDAARHVAHQIHENGVTYNVYAESAAPPRPWSLDVLPRLITAEDWAELERGLTQRARLLDAIAADIYGAGRLVAERVLPAALVLNHPGFLRPCHGIMPPGGTYVHLAAFDVARAPDGGWTVVGTRVQAPSGLGYALENRTIISRVFPDAARALGVRPLTPFFDAVQDALLSAAPADEDSAVAVLLTPGRFNETYFEHVFLARELGLPLVQGDDLTVRDDRVYLKTVSGLQQVHSIWRRVDDDYCDPLELRSDSTLGVPGLVQAWRAGRVLIANTLGLSVLEAPALAAFLPAMATRLLGEPLLVPSVETVWCGDDDAPPRVGSDDVIRSAWSAAVAPVMGSTLTPVEIKAWRARIATAPDAYARQRFLPLSHGRVWQDGRLVARAVSVRVFLVTDGRGDYRVLPGGLCRVAGDHRNVVSSRRGGSSKDTWVLSTESADAVVSPPVRRRALGHEYEWRTSSRAADNLFWLGRYAERSENGARLLRATLSRVAGAAWPAHGAALLARACLGQGLLLDTDVPTDSDGQFTGSLVGLERALISGLRDRGPRRLRSNIEHTVRVADSVRDRLSSDNWRVLGQLPADLTDGLRKARGFNDILAVVDDLILGLVAAGGLETAHMTRDDGWRFLSLGRHLERLTFLAECMDAIETEDVTSDPQVLEWLLELSDSIITYRARYMRRPEWSAVLDLLLLDERNPRSAMFQVARLDKHVRLLPDANLVDVLHEIDRVRRAARPARSTPLFDPAPAESLPRACEQLALTLSDALTLRYFSHVYDRPQSVEAR
jgi:uncharacterized circularly permuted ATP-grasp superfamily protein/uncharacterized alpha-E superfamily protein